MKIHLFRVVYYVPEMNMSKNYDVQGISKFTVKICEKLKLSDKGYKLISVTKLK